MHIQVDEQDRDLLRYAWNPNHNGYLMAHRRNTTKPSGHEMFRLHREVMARILGRSLLKEELVDHINHDKLDNRRANLRVADASQSLFNLRAKDGGSSRFIGVFWDAPRSTWRAEVRAYNSRFYVGRFDSELEAAWMRDQYASELHGDFASLNFDYI